MFPSSGKFRLLHCPYHVQGNCGRIYCHYRHIKNKEDKLAETSELQKLEKRVCSILKLDKEQFRIIVDEEDENVHEKLLNNKLKNSFLGNDVEIDNFHFPESMNDIISPSAHTSSNQSSVIDFINLTDDASIDDRPLKQLLEEDAKHSSSSENNKCNAAEKRHMIITCLEKSVLVPKRQVRVVNERAVTLTQEAEKTDDIPIQPLYISAPSDRNSLKQEEESDSSDPETEAEVDKILTQMELMDPHLFKTDECVKHEPAEPENELLNNIESKNFSHNSNDFVSSLSNTNLIGRINLKSVQAINSEISLGIVKPDTSFHKLLSPPALPQNESIVETARIAEQNRLKNLFKSTICSNIDQFFDLSDACNVYGTEIFNLLEPLLNYLIEKLNPEFNFEKLQKFHAQNFKLSGCLPFVTSCNHSTHCIECHNLLRVALSRSSIRKFNKSTQTCSSLNSFDETPLRKIEVELFDITKEMLSLSVPVNNQSETRSVQCQTESSSHRKSSGSHKSRSYNKLNSSVHEHKSRSSTDGKIDGHGSKKHEHSHSSVHSRRSSKFSKDKSEKKKKESDTEFSDSKEPDNREKLLKSEDSEKNKRKSSGKHSGESKKMKTDYLKTEQNSYDGIMDRNVTKDDNGIVCSEDDDADIFGSAISDGDSDLKSEDESKPKTDRKQNVAEDNRILEVEANEFVVKVPSVPSKKRISHITESNISSVYRKPKLKKNIPSPSEVLFRRIQAKKAEQVAALAAENPSSKIRIAQVSNIAQILKAREQLKIDQIMKPQPDVPARTIAQTAYKGQRVAHDPVEPPRPKDVPPQANNFRPTISTFKSSHNIPTPIRQDGLNRLYNAFAKKVPPEMACELALKEEQTIHEKVTIQKIYMQSLAMAVHRIAKEDPAKLIAKPNEFPLAINGHSVYDLLGQHILTYEQMEMNGFPLPVPGKPGCCRISTKAIHYKSLLSKRSGDSFYCQQCKDLFEIDPETRLPITPITGCRFHSMRARKEAGRTRHDMYYPCCNKGISESGCNAAQFHTPDTTDDDCLEGFLETRDAQPGEQGKKMFYSLDCEMCYTTVGSELTRVTVVGHDCNVVYDSLIKPRNKVLDYCTKFSGITEEKLRKVTKTLEDVRRELFKFIFKDTILIGHSLENDLKALKILHYKIVDTSVLYPHRDAPERKFSLKFLASTVVQFLIQESESGHDSKEDALACMKLIWKKVREDAKVYRPKKIINSPVKHVQTII